MGLCEVCIRITARRAVFSNALAANSSSNQHDTAQIARVVKPVGGTMQIAWVAGESAVSNEWNCPPLCGLFIVYSFILLQLLQKAFYRGHRVNRVFFLRNMPQFFKHHKLAAFYIPLEVLRIFRWNQSVQTTPEN